MFRRIIIRAFIQKLRVMTQNIKTMRKTGRDPEHVLVLFRQKLPHPFSEGWRSFSNVDSYIINLAAYYPHQFSLWLFDLIMQPTKHSLG